MSQDEKGRAENVLEDGTQAMNNNGYQDWTLEGVTEAGIVLEELLEEVIAFTELRLLCRTVPPDRSLDLQRAEEEVQTIKSMLSKLLTPHSSPNKPEPEQTCERYNTCAVPPDNGVAKSTRQRGVKLKNKTGIEPVGYNGSLWKSMQDMKRMFTRGKLLRGTVPPRKKKQEETDGNQQPNYLRVTTNSMERMSGMPEMSIKVGKLSSSRMDAENESTSIEPNQKNQNRQPV